MVKITITIPDDDFLKLKGIAARFNVRPEELICASVEELLARPEDAFKRVVDYILNKNAEFYRRLA